jgi:hypothetical protein
VAPESSNRPLEIKAPVLARQSDAGIAWRVGLPVPAVKAFVGLFFDIRERIDARTYIIHCVIGFKPDWVPTPEDLMLLTAYLHGPGMIDPWLDFLQHVDEQHDLTTDVGRMRASLQLLLDVHRLPSDEAIQASLVRRQNFIAMKMCKSPKINRVAGVISQKMSQMRGEIAWAKESAPTNEAAGQAEDGFFKAATVRECPRARAG